MGTGRMDGKRFHELLCYPDRLYLEICKMQEQTESTQRLLAYYRAKKKGTVCPDCEARRKRKQWYDRRKTEGMVYVMTDRVGRLKVGFTKHLASRFLKLKTGCPTLEVVQTFEGLGKDHERLAHETIGEFHVGGEWFDDTAVARKTVLHYLNHAARLLRMEKAAQ